MFMAALKMPKGPSIYYVSKEVGGRGQKNCNFCLHTYLDGWVLGWAQKRPKTC